MLNAFELKRRVFHELSKIGVYNLEDYSFECNKAGSKDGIYIYISENRYHYVYSERGNESEHRVTKSALEVTYWIIDSVIDTLSIENMRKSIEKGENQRALIFAKKRELYEKIGSDFKKMGMQEIDNLLKEYPV